MLAIPIVRQTAPYSCGSAALLACLLYWRSWVLDACERELWPALGTCAETGTEAGPIAKVARTHGLVAASRREMTVAELRRHAERGDTVIIAIQAWPLRVFADWSEVWDDGHWVVVVGFDGDRVIVMDPSTFEGYAYVDEAELPLRWHDLDARGRKAHGLAVVIRGREHLESFPAPPKRLG